MNFFDQLKTAALDFVKTPFAQKLAFGDNGVVGPTPAPATAPAAQKSPAWLWPTVLVGGALVLLALVWSAFRK